MSALPIITEITNQGITARVEGDEVALSAPKGTLTPEVVAKLKSKKPDLLRSLKELQERAGPDWQEISTDAAKLKALAELVMIEDMRHRGIVPDHYTNTTECKHCGTVPIWPGCPSQVHGCPWCMNRHQGLPMRSNEDIHCEDSTGQSESKRPIEKGIENNDG